MLAERAPHACHIPEAFPGSLSRGIANDDIHQGVDSFELLDSLPVFITLPPA